MNILVKKIIFAILAFGAVLVFDFATAQSNPEDILKSPISLDDFIVEFSPENPGANARVTAQADSYSFDINAASITWILNGKTSGGGRMFSFATGNMGMKTNLTVSVTTSGGKKLVKNFTFQSAETDILWQTDGYSPMFYRGKTLAVAKSLIKAVAMPQGIETADSRLVYEWRRNGKNIPDASGVGKKTFTFYAAETGNEIVEVKVSTSNKSAVADGSVEIKINEPKILFYENSPLEGPLYQKELGDSYFLQNKELTLKAEPYFFSKRALQNMPLVWKVNDQKIRNSQRPALLNLAVPENNQSLSADRRSVSIIELALQNPLNILEMAEKKIQINF